MKPILKAFLTILMFMTTISVSKTSAQCSEFYGLFMRGGINGTGAIYKTDGNGENLQVICSFSPDIDGTYPIGSLCVAPNGKYYGRTYSGGIYDDGVLFELDIITNKITKKYDFNNNEKASTRFVSLIPEDNGKFLMLYSSGIINEWDPVSNIISEKTNLRKDEDPYGPNYSRLIKVKNGKYYGIATHESYDELFEWDPVTNISIMWDVFYHSGDHLKSRVCGDLLEADNGKLYGITSGSGYIDEAFIFEWNISTNTYTNKIELSDALNNYPYNSMIQADNGKFYGMLGGREATIFEWDSTTNICIEKYRSPELHGSINNNPGRFKMMQADNGKIYGIYETIFNIWDGISHRLYEWDPVTNSFNIKAVLSNFVSYPNGSITEVIYASSSTMSVEACNSYTSPSGKIWTDSGEFKDTVPTTTGCDSIITVYLIINKSTSNIISQTACDSYTSPGGKIWTVSGEYKDTINNAVGCDSIITVNLTITSTDTSVTQDLGVLTANTTGASYQWIDCDDGDLPIEGETRQTFSPTITGRYAVIITQNNCIDTSACFSVIKTGLMVNTFKQSIILYPNPNDGSFSIDLGGIYPKVEVSISELDGRIIRKDEVYNSQILDMQISALRGMYMVIVSYENERAVFKVVKE